VIGVGLRHIETITIWLWFVKSQIEVLGARSVR
jgi:hypothetical protein